MGVMRDDLQARRPAVSKTAADGAVMRTATPATRAAVARLLAQRVEQGLPLHITDPGTTYRVASIVRSVRRKAA